jgi:hypothetical protein
MTMTLKQVEGDPASYPPITDGLSTAAGALNADFIWQRIEAYTAWRWSERTVEWVVEGPGLWSAPLAPAIVTTTEIWTGESWEAATLSPSPLGGYYLPGCGPYRLAGTVGDDETDAPAAVLEAFRRLAEYMAAKPGTPGATSESVSAGSISKSHNRSAEWMARAMVNSGAADLLRRYRRA